MATSDPCTVCGEVGQHAKGKCRRCYHREYMRQRRANGAIRDKELMWGRRYYAKNRQKKIADARAWNLAHPDKHAANERRYYYNKYVLWSNRQVLEVMGCR
jgi:predicted ATP-dependent serine protease